MSHAELSEPIGRPFLGRYRLIKKIAVGGMAELYLARASGVGGFEKNVVVKRILPQLAESEQLFRMFLDEARIAATLDHPNVVQVYDACQEDGEYFIAMEYLDGTDLRTLRMVLADRGLPLPWEHALYIGVGIAAGLHYAHEKRDLDGQPLAIVHRDVTPHNVFLTREGGIKLVDFGIAKARNRLTETVSGTLKGKLAYMSPEQCNGDPVDRRGDIYSLGILLYELTTGRRLYSGNTEYQLLKEIVESEVAPPSSFMEFPQELEAVIMRCLAKDPDQRYATAREVQRDLEDFARSYNLLMSALGLSSFLEPLLEAATLAAKERWRRRRERLPRIAPERPVATLSTEEQSSFERGRSLRSRAAASSDPMWSSDGSSNRGLQNASGVPELIGASDVEEPRTARVPAAILAKLAEDERRIAELEAAAERYSQPNVAPRQRFARGTGGPELEGESAAVIVDLDDLGSPHHDSSGSQRLARASTTEERRRAEVMPLSLPARVELRRGTGAVWLLAIGLAAAAATAWYVSRRSPQSDATPPASARPGAPPTSGHLVVAGEPGADVWLFLGRTPIEAYAVHNQDAHRIRVEHDGYRSRELYLGEDSWRREKSGQLTAVASVELAHASPGDDRGPVPEKPFVPSYATRPSKVSVESDPSAAGVWLYLGQTPDARAGNLDVNRSIELRIERDHATPQFLVVDRTDFDDSGTARVEIPTAPPAPEPHEPVRRWRAKKNAPAASEQPRQWKPRSATGAVRPAGVSKPSRRATAGE